MRGLCSRGFVYIYIYIYLLVVGSRGRNLGIMPHLVKTCYRFGLDFRQVFHWSSKYHKNREKKIIKRLHI